MSLYQKMFHMLIVILLVFAVAVPVYAADTDTDTVVEAEAADTEDAATDEPEDVQEDKVRLPNSIGPLRIFGTTEIINQSYSTSGNEAQFLSQNNLLYHDTFRQKINLKFDGTLDDGTALTGQFTDLPYIDNVFSIAADGRNYFAHAGDTRAKFESGEMTTFSKNIRGLDFGYTRGNTEFGVLYSNQKSKTTSEAFLGRNIRGPYVLRATSIVENTEVVKLNGVVQPRSAYVMDYFLGEITFNQTIDPSDRVEIHYEEAVWLELSAGNLFGASVRQKLMGGKASAGVSFLREETDVLQNAKIFSATLSEQKQNLLDVASGNYIFNLGQSRLEKNYEVISAAATTTVYLTANTDYTIDYASGSVTFINTAADFAALPGTATITVVFNYYDQGYLQWIQDEELSGEGEIEYQLAYERIYAGTELVTLYDNGTYVRQLVSGTDYEINEGNNTIVFLDTNVIPSESFGRTVQISYEIVPEVDRVAQQDLAERTITSAFGDYSKGGLDLNAEVAQSNADLRQKTVQVLDELVAFVAVATQREYTLQNEAIYNSVEVYFDDPAIPSSRQRSGTDYTIEADPATGNTLIRFKNDIPIGTTIIANYRYQTNNTQLQDRKGEAGRVRAAYSMRDMSFKGEYMRKSAYFSPLTSYNDLETERLFAGFNYTGIKNVTLDLDFKDQTTNNDLTSAQETELKQMTARMGYSLGGDNSLAYTLETRDRSDNLATKLTDNDLTGHRVDFNYRLSNSIKTKAHYETRDFTDNTGNTSDRDTKRGGVSVDYTGQALTLGMSLDNSKLTSTPPAAFANISKFTIDTFSTRLNANYNPGGNVMFNATMDSQRLDDERVDASDEKLDSIRAELTGVGEPSSRLTAPRNFLLSFYRQDRPDPTYGNSRTDISTIRVTYKVGRDYLVTPSFVATKAIIGTGSNSKDNNAGFLLQYRSGATRGWIISTSYSDSNRTGQTVSSTTGAVSNYSNDQKQLGLNLKYIPSDILAWTGIYQSTDTSTGGTSRERKTYTSRFDYVVNEVTSVDFVYNKEENPGASGDRATYEFGSSTVLDRHLTLTLSYKKQEQEGSSTQDYDGTLFTMRLIVTF